jgi:hypothetical protein
MRFGCELEPEHTLASDLFRAELRGRRDHLPSIIPITLARTPLMSFETQSLRSHSLYLLIKRVDLLVMPHDLRLCVPLTQLVECFLY